MHDRDIQAVRLMGTFAFVMGLTLFLLTGLATLLLLATGIATSTTNFFRGAVGVILAIVMASSLAGCGGELRRIGTQYSPDRESLRLVWTALVLVMFFGGLAGLWLVPPLSALAVLTLLALFAVRGAVIRLTGH